MSQNLALFGGKKTIQLSENHNIWPKITPAVEQAVLRQLHTSVSIYDRSGVFKDFEDTFAQYHNRRYALLSNSGTNAIYSMFEGINLKPGDEVICPVYTFFATVSPLMHMGAIPIFCDSKNDGNIDPEKIDALVTPKTKAIIITHMWGIPCDMDALIDICKRNNLKLLEDCSHAHGALYKGKAVGSFGDAAAWSMQGQKIITGGEGGIMLTDDEEIYYKAVLQGHYNKRCKQVIPNNHALARFSTTGLGLKFRAHPLAIAIAQEQFSHIDEWLNQKRVYARDITNALSKVSFLKLPKTLHIDPSWYAYVMQYDASLANNVPIDIFHQAVLAEGLAEFDRPNSTSPLHYFALFNEPDIALPRLYPASSATNKKAFPQAEAFYLNALKMPVWTLPEEKHFVDLYIQGILKVAEAIEKSPEQFLEYYINLHKAKA